MELGAMSDPRLPVLHIRYRGRLYISLPLAPVVATHDIVPECIGVQTTYSLCDIVREATETTDDWEGYVQNFREPYPDSIAFTLAMSPYRGPSYMMIPQSILAHAVPC
jgi:hypothetical protein